MAYIDTVLPFGLCSAPKVYNALADSLEWILHDMGIEYTLHYLDDFLFMGKPECDECESFLNMVTTTF